MFYSYDLTKIVERLRFKVLFTRSSAIAKGPRDAPYQLKPGKMSHKLFIELHLISPATGE